MASNNISNQRDLYFRSDIKNTLEAIDHANRTLTRRISTPESDAYRDGFSAALESVAVAFNLELNIANERVIDVEVNQGRKPKFLR